MVALAEEKLSRFIAAVAEELNASIPTARMSGKRARRRGLLVPLNLGAHFRISVRKSKKYARTFGDGVTL